jgi:hypothetical protein
LGFLRPPVPEALLYVVFKVQFREYTTKLPFQPATCQYPNFHTHSKALFHKIYKFPVNRFFREGASKYCCT